MRTTVDIDEALLERAKRLALKEKQTLGAVVGQALAAYLGGRRQAGKDPPFELIVAGSADGLSPRRPRSQLSRKKTRPRPSRSQPGSAMLLPDVNVLIYAHRRESPEHERWPSSVTDESSLPSLSN